LGGSQTLPPDLAPLAPLLQAVNKAAVPQTTIVPHADKEYAKIHDPAFVRPALPVYAAKLNGLLKDLANAHGALTESVRARKAYTEALSKLLEAQKKTLTADEARLAEITIRRDETDKGKQEAEDAIMAGLTSTDDAAPKNEKPDTTMLDDGDDEIKAPSVESLTPPGSPPPSAPQPNFVTSSAAAAQTLDQLIRSASNSLAPENSLPSQSQSVSPPPPAAATHTPGFDLLSSLSLPSNGASLYNTGFDNGAASTPPLHQQIQNQQAAAADTNGDAWPSSKKRKLEPEAEPSGTEGMDELDPEVAAMLREN
jgi:regulator of Ty1 transposition protein 103